LNRGSANDRLQKLRKLVMAENSPILLTQQKNINWLFGGRSHINLASEPGCCNYLVTNDTCILIVNNIEAKRLVEEEIQNDVWAETDVVEVWDWFNPSDRAKLLQSHVAKGSPLKTDVELEMQFLDLRSIVDEDRIEEVKQIGRRTAEAIEEAARDSKCGDTEYTIAGRLAYRCYERELEPIVNLVAVDERIYSRRHPLPTGKTLQSYAMLVVCARRKGLIASATRLVHFGAIPDDIDRKFRAVVEIDARMIDTTSEGKTLGDIFAEMKSFYRDAGYPDEFKQHHQGGLTGYTTREKISTPQETMSVRKSQLYAWNPSIAGVKSEDTMLVGAEENEIITSTGFFPQVEIKVGQKTYVRPGILQR